PRAVELLGYRWPGQSPKGGGDDLARATPQKDSGRHASRWRGRCANRGPKSPCDDRAATKYGRTWDNAISFAGSGEGHGKLLIAENVLNLPKALELLIANVETIVIEFHDRFREAFGNKFIPNISLFKEKGE